MCYHHVPLQRYYYNGESLNLSVFHPSGLARPSFVGFPQHTMPSPPLRVELPLVVSVVDGESAGSKEKDRKEEEEEEEDYDSFSW